MASLGFEGQKVYGTFREQFVKLQSSLDDAVSKGAATPEEYKATLLHILKGIEALRLKSESELMRIKEQEAQQVAMIRSCSMLGGLLLNIVEARTREHAKIREGQELIERKYIEELRGQLEELKAAGKEDDYKSLALEIARREQALESVDRAETDITVKAVKEAVVEQETSYRSHMQPVVEDLSEVIQNTLEEVPVDEMKVVSKGGNGETKKRKFPPKRK